MKYPDFEQGYTYLYKVKVGQKFLRCTWPKKGVTSLVTGLKLTVSQE